MIEWAMAHLAHPAKPALYSIKGIFYWLRRQFVIEFQSATY